MRVEAGVILVAEDDEDSARIVSDLLGAHGYSVTCVGDGQAALAAISSRRFDLALLDIMMPSMSGLEVCARVRADESGSYVPIVLVSARHQRADIIQGLDGGADDYIAKPFDQLELVARVRSLIRVKRMHEQVIDTLTQLSESRDEISRLRRETQERYSAAKIVGAQSGMKLAIAAAAAAAEGPGVILIFGETGTGKELVARYVHDHSRRQDKPFVVQDCAALTDTLAESELFGYRKGAFTGADSDRKGLFEAANGGTIFLDEIGEASPTVQARLLRVLQERQVRRIGEVTYRDVDVKIVAATNRDLAKEAAAGRFRSDLYFRLNVMEIRLKPLRERKGDIPELVANFLEKHGRRKRVSRIGDEAMALLMAYEFPGNVRELQNEIERAVMLCAEGDTEIGAEHLSDRVREGLVEQGALRPTSLRYQIEALERKMIQDVLRRHDGNKSRAAEELGLSRLGLRQKMARYSLGD
jgi:DNA-binding NtrC family response regulator